MQHNTNLCFLTPTIDGAVDSAYVSSLMETTRLLAQHKIDWCVRFLVGESLVTRARNKLVAEVLQHNNNCAIENRFSHIFFIDADIAWKPDSVVRLLAHDQPIVAGLYPQKRYMWERLDDLERVLAGKDHKLNEGLPLHEFIETNLLRHNVNWLREQGDQRIERGLMRVLHAPTGFLLINMQVFDLLIGKFGQTHHCLLDELNPLNPFHYRFFDTGVNDSGVYLSEDWYFSELCHKAGIPVFADINVDLTHTGKNRFRGRLKSQFNFVDNKLAPKY